MERLHGMYDGWWGTSKRSGYPSHCEIVCTNSVILAGKSPILIGTQTLLSRLENAHYREGHKPFYLDLKMSNIERDKNVELFEQQIHDDYLAFRLTIMSLFNISILYHYSQHIPSPITWCVSTFDSTITQFYYRFVIQWYIPVIISRINQW